MKKKIALVHKEWSESSVRIMEGVFSLPEIRQRCEFRDFPLCRGGTEITFPEHWQPDGILFTMDEGDPRASAILNSGVPAVRLGNDWKRDQVPTSCVGLLSFCKLGISHFESLSCPNLLFVGVDSQYDSHRAARLLRRLTPKSLIREFRTVFFDDVGSDVSRLDQPLANHPQILKALQEMPAPFGVLTLRDNDAVYLLNACKEAGVTVCKEVGILSGTDTRRVQFADPPISAMVVDYLEIGKRGAAMLEKLMAGSPLTKRVQRIQYTTVTARASTLGDRPLDQNIERVRRLIQDRACEGITVEEILTHLDISRPTLEKRYRELTGASPAQHIRAKRAEVARELLLTTNYSIAKVARAVGFDDPRPFMVFFKREFGQTPGSFRLAHA